ncbi:MAG: hypothetical protein IT279_10125 [Ignavibacteriaceae bacterium]|nr:hypothetical protein [Ignavibacteriaceae bacterium]
MKFTFHLSKSRVQFILIFGPLSVLLIPLLLVFTAEQGDSELMETVTFLTAILTPLVTATELFLYIRYASVPCEIVFEDDGMHVTPLKKSRFYPEAIFVRYSFIRKVFFQTFRGEKTVIKPEHDPEFMILKSRSIFSDRELSAAWKQYTYLLAEKTGVPAPH